MAKFPGLVGATYASQSPSASAEECLNWYPERIERPNAKAEYVLYPTAGLALFCALNGTSVRGIIEFNGRAFATAGVKFYEIDSFGNVSERGTVIADGQMASITAGQGAGGPGYVLLASAGNVYVYNLATNTFTAIGAATLTNIGLVAYADGYFVAVERASNKFYLSGLLDATSWNPADSTRIQIFSGNIITAIVDHGEILLAGPQAGVAYINTGDVFPFSPSLTARIEQGSGASFAAVRLDNSVYWLGANEHGQGIAWRLNGATPVRVSTHAVEFAWSLYPRIDDAVAYAYQDQGHAFWQISFPSAKNGLGETWVYDAATNLWHKRGFLEQDGKISMHRSQCHAFAFGKHLVGDCKSANIYQMAIPQYNAGVYTFADDFGNAIRRVRRTTYVDSEKERIFFDRLRVLTETGIGPIPALQEAPTPTIVYLKDSNGVLYQIYVNAGGLLTATVVTVGAETPVILSDATGTKSYRMGVSILGKITATEVSFSAAYPLSIVLPNFAGAAWTVTVSLGGLWQSDPAALINRGPKFMHRYSNDGAKTWSNELTRDAGQAGEYSKRVFWNMLGSCDGPRGRVFELATSDKWAPRLIGADLQAH